MTSFQLCSRCGSRYARYFPITVLGALTLSKHHLCADCTAEVDEEADRQPPSAVHDVAELGPIQFDTLRESFANAEAHDDPAVLAGYEPLVRRIAAAHRQVIPADIERVFRRWRAQ